MQNVLTHIFDRELHGQKKGKYTPAPDIVTYAEHKSRIADANRRYKEQIEDEARRTKPRLLERRQEVAAWKTANPMWIINFQQPRY